jgi:hypothetical protein
LEADCAGGGARCFSARAFNIFSLLWRRLIFCLRRRLNLALSPLIPDINSSPAFRLVAASAGGGGHKSRTFELPALNDFSYQRIVESAKLYGRPLKPWPGIEKNLPSEVFRTDTLLAFQGNLLIAKAQRAVQGVFEVKVYSIRRICGFCSDPLAGKSPMVRRQVAITSCKLMSRRVRFLKVVATS